MLKLDPADSGRWADIYAVANTPSYLFRRLRAEASINALAKSASSSVLAEHVDGIAAKLDRSLVDVATAYAAIVALSCQDTAEARREMSRLLPTKLEWCAELVRLYEQARVGYTLTNMLLPPRPIGELQKPKASQTNTSLILASAKP